MINSITEPNSSSKLDLGHFSAEIGLPSTASTSMRGNASEGPFEMKIS